MSRVKFEAKNPGSLGLPIWLSFLMVSLFSIPLLLIPMIPISEIVKTPALLVFYPIAVFPLGVLYVLRRLMTRYGLRVYENGDARIEFPFKIVQIKQGTLREIVVQTRFVAALNGYRTWIQFVDLSGRILASLSPNAFASEPLHQFIAAVKETNPGVDFRVA
jgi:hypothetical protein